MSPIAALPLLPTCLRACGLDLPLPFVPRPREFAVMLALLDCGITQPLRGRVTGGDQSYQFIAAGPVEVVVFLDDDRLNVLIHVAVPRAGVFVEVPVRRPQRFEGGERGNRRLVEQFV